MWLFSWLLGNRKHQNNDDATARLTAGAAAGPVIVREASTEPVAGDAAEASVIAMARIGFITPAFAHLTKIESVQAMTEEAWLASSDPLAMLCFLHGRAGGRKFRLFAAACARDLLAQGEHPEEQALPSKYRFGTAILEAEPFADGQGELKNPARFVVALPVCDVITDEDVAHGALGFDADVGLWTTPIDEIVPEMIKRYRTHPAQYLRDIFGPLPFRPIFPPGPWVLAWNDGAVCKLARSIYDDRALPKGHFDPARLGMLADALEDAGCTDAAILSHCREPGEHVRGCWVVDLLLGKQ